MAARHCQVGHGKKNVSTPGSPALSIVISLCSLMGRHLWHSSILTTLTLLQTLVVESLLLLLLCHVATMWRRTRYAGLCGRHCRDVFWGVGYVAGVDAIFVASRFRSIQAGLDMCCK